MTPEDAELLQNVGQVFIANISSLVTESVLYGLYLVIFTFGIRALLTRKTWTRSTWTLFAFLLILCLTLTANLVVTVAFNIELIRGSLVNSPEIPLIDRLQLAVGRTIGLINALTWLSAGTGGGILVVFADAVVVWRACVLWPGDKIVRAFLLALLFASFGSAVISSTLRGIFFPGSNTVANSSAIGIMSSLSQSLSLATNISATMLIGYKAYYHRQMMKASMGLRNSRSGVILLFLTESGITFCILQVIVLATDVTDNVAFTAHDYAATVWQEITLFAAAAYPVLVLIIIDNHRSFSDSTGGSAADSGFAQRSNGIGSHLSFAARPPDASGGAVSEDNMVVSRVDPTASVDHSQEESVRMRDLEKGEGLPTGGTASAQAEC